jgi:YggT family protein
VDLVLGLLGSVVFLFFLFLLARLVIDWIQVFSRDWTPKGAVLVVAESVFTVTDPPINAVRRVVPPLKLGQVQLDLAFLVVMLVTVILMRVL